MVAFHRTTCVAGFKTVKIEIIKLKEAKKHSEQSRAQPLSQGEVKKQEPCSIFYRLWFVT